MTNAFEKFYKKSISGRRAVIKKSANLSPSELKLFENALGSQNADQIIENVVGTYELPLGIATNFVVNGRQVVVPMAVEEPSVVAAASNAAKLCKATGGFKTKASKPEMIGQIQLVKVKNPASALKKIIKEKKNLVKIANSRDPLLVKYGGGARDIEAKTIFAGRKKMVIIYLTVDVRDAMGANAVNTMCEAIAPELERMSGGIARLRIISNLAVKRTAKAKAVWKKKDLEKSAKGTGMTGQEIVDAIIESYELAENDIYRCATHNKGIMNGVDAIAVACGQDWRAIEAGAHAFAAKTGQYKSLTKYSKDKQGNLVGEIEIPVAVGIVGGAIKAQPLAQLCVKLTGVKTAQELGEIIAAVGLAQNFAALRALSTEGIQRGHMRLHARMQGEKK